MNIDRSDLLQKLKDQEKEIDIYRTKLRDVVIAHKRLLTEKEALEASLQALQIQDVDESSKEDETHEEIDNMSTTSVPESSEKSFSVNESQNQVGKLLNSLKVLTVEKSKLEEQMKYNSRTARQENEEYEQKLETLKNKLKGQSLEIDDLKKQLMVEKHERDKEQIDHGLMIKELQSIIANQRDVKSKLGNDVDELKRKLVNSKDMIFEGERKEAKMQSITSELKQTKFKLDGSQGRLKEVSDELVQVREEMKNLSLKHQMAIQAEKEVAKQLDRQLKKNSAVHEERVLGLEARLAELSQTVGSYDRVRHNDQMEIVKLKGHIAALDTPSFVAEKTGPVDSETIIRKILELKSQLRDMCNKSGEEFKFKDMFCENYSDNNLHETCTDEYNKLKKEFEVFRSQLKSRCTSDSQESNQKEKITLQNQVKSLQERIKLISENSREMEKEFKLQVEQLRKATKNDKARFKETLAASETDYRGRLCLLEQQLQKQRERSLALLEEKEQEIHSLQSTFQMFLPDYRNASESAEDDDESSKDVNVSGLTQRKDGPHLLHYANELARRDVEIANLRKNKHKVEIALRELQKAAMTDTENHRDERQVLREEIARLNRCQTREGANLEYLKNVVLNFLLSGDASSKRHMCNAIAAVLKFSDAELEKVTQHSRNSWWNRSSYL